jgi:DNA-binding SARP family transcriptional activator
MAQGSARAADVARVLVCLLGGFRLLKQGNPLSLRPGGRTQSILSALALGPRPSGIPRDDLLQLLWPQAEPGLALQALHTLVYSLHRSLGDALGGQGPIVNIEGRYRLNAEAGVVVDVDRFDSVVDAADRLVRAGESERAIGRYRDAAGLYEGDLVIGSDVQHVLERERLRARYLGVRARLANYHLALGEIDAALDNALDILSHDPYREDAHRIAMRCYVRLGHRAQALRQYRICRDILMTEFEAAPERATEELYDLVRLEPVLV